MQQYAEDLMRVQEQAAALQKQREQTEWLAAQSKAQQSTAAWLAQQVADMAAQVQAEQAKEQASKAHRDTIIAGAEQARARQRAAQQQAAEQAALQAAQAHASSKAHRDAIIAGVEQARVKQRAADAAQQPAQQPAQRNMQEVQAALAEQQKASQWLQDLAQVQEATKTWAAQLRAEQQAAEAQGPLPTKEEEVARDDEYRRNLMELYEQLAAERTDTLAKMLQWERVQPHEDEPGYAEWEATRVRIGKASEAGQDGITQVLGELEAANVKVDTIWDRLEAEDDEQERQRRTAQVERNAELKARRTKQLAGDVEMDSEEEEEEREVEQPVQKQVEQPVAEDEFLPEAVAVAEAEEAVAEAEAKVQEEQAAVNGAIKAVLKASDMTPLQKTHSVTSLYKPLIAAQDELEEAQLVLQRSRRNSAASSSRSMRSVEGNTPMPVLQRSRRNSVSSGGSARSFEGNTPMPAASSPKGEQSRSTEELTQRSDRSVAAFADRKATEAPAKGRRAFKQEFDAEKQREERKDAAAANRQDKREATVNASRASEMIQMAPDREAKLQRARATSESRRAAQEAAETGPSGIWLAKGTGGEWSEEEVVTDDDQMDFDNVSTNLRTGKATLVRPIEEQALLANSRVSSGQRGSEGYSARQPGTWGTSFQGLAPQPAMVNVRSAGGSLASAAKQVRAGATRAASMARRRPASSSSSAQYSQNH
jgi:hypothetical protein